MKTEFQNLVINRLRKLRIQKNLSQAAVADLLGISPGQIGNIESCRQPHKYTLKQISILCDRYNYPIEQLFVNSDKAPLSTEEIINRIIEYEENTIL